MSINIKLGKSDDVIKINLDAKKTIDGNIIIADHPDIDIIIKTVDNKIVAFPKENIDDIVYDLQNRFFDFLARKGIVNREDIRSGNVFGTLEAKLPEPSEENVDIVQVALYIISKFVDGERPYFEYSQEHEDRMLQDLLEPDVESSTELGEVPHDVFKGSIRPGMVRRYGHGFYYLYENKEKKEG